jgi:hypothetical protein
MTRDELAAIFADILGLRIRPIEIDTLLRAVDKHVELAARTAAQATAELLTREHQ